jgi:transcriptional regulator with XRE-family HTH domain
MNVEHEVERLTTLLAAAVKFSDVTQREVERKLGLSSGSLSRLFSGGIELKVKHILDICEVIGFSPARFFRAAYPLNEEDDGEARRLQRLLEQLHPAREEKPPAPEPPPPAPGPSQDEIERMVFAALTKFFSEMGKPATG